MVGLHRKGVFQVELFVLSRNWLAMGRSALPASKTSNTLKHHTIRYKLPVTK